MATSAIRSYGTLLKIGDGATSEAFTTIAEVTSLSGPSLELRTAEVTAHDGGGWAEHIGTILDAGEISFGVNFVPTNDTHDYPAGLLKDMTDRTLRNFQFVFPDTGSTTWTLPAYVVSFEPDAPVDGALSAEFTIRVSGAPTLA